MIVYSVGCNHCKMLMMLLDAKKIEYKEVCPNSSEIEMLSEKGFRSLPVVELEDGNLISYQDAIKLIRER